MKMLGNAIIRMRLSICVVILLSFLSGCDENWDEGGVLLGNEIPTYALNYIQEHDILAREEKLIAFYDVTIVLDATEAALLTDKRVIYHKDNKNSDIRYSDILNVKHSEESWTGDVFIIQSKEGDWMKIEIAPFNGGSVFKEVLMGQLPS